MNVKHILFLMIILFISYACKNFKVSDCLYPNTTIYIINNAPLYEILDNGDLGEMVGKTSFTSDSTIQDGIYKNCLNKDNKDYFAIDYQGKTYYISQEYSDFKLQQAVIKNNKINLGIIENSNVDNPKIEHTNYKSTSGTTHEWHVGPRGGVYYINSKGKKVYKKKNQDN